MINFIIYHTVYNTALSCIRRRWWWQLLPWCPLLGATWLMLVAVGLNAGKPHSAVTAALTIWQHKGNACFDWVGQQSLPESAALQHEHCSLTCVQPWYRCCAHCNQAWTESQATGNRQEARGNRQQARGTGNRQQASLQMQHESGQQSSRNKPWVSRCWRPWPDPTASLPCQHRLLPCDSQICTQHVRTSVELNCIKSS